MRNNGSYGSPKEPISSNETNEIKSEKRRQIAAIYARYSTEEQRATSIEDQVRRARAKAVALGYEVPDEFIFYDAIVTGQAKGLKKRKGYEELLKAWGDKKFVAVFVDEVSRLARDAISLAELQTRIEISKVRLVTTDGLDSATPGWQLQYGVCGVMASHFVRETSHRVKRGMIGQLERGFMIAAPPFGYKATANNGVGTKWTIDKKKAIVVRSIFQHRRKGLSYTAIAKLLNQQGIKSPRPAKKDRIRYWRSATVRQLINNTIYRGLFVWNGSPYSKAREKRGEVVLETIDYPRPALRLVDDDTWFSCNQSGEGWKFRGGDKHVFAGLVRCSTCGSRLTVATGGSAPSLYCAQCAQAAACAVVGRKGGYVSCKAVQEVLTQAVENVFSPDAELLFRERLLSRLEGGQEELIAEQKVVLTKIEGKIKTLIRLQSDVDTDDPALEAEYRKMVADKRRVVAEVAALEVEWSKLDSAALELQLQVDPRKLLPKLFSGEVPASETRAALGRLFPKILFRGKPSKFCSLFSVECARGVLLAESSETKVIDSGVVTMFFRVTGSAKRPSTWLVEEIESCD